MMFDNLPTSLPLVQGWAAAPARRVGRQPWRRYPRPTFAELELDDMNWMAFFGLVAPKGTPDPVVKKLNAALLQVLEMPEVRGELRRSRPRGRWFFRGVRGAVRRELARMQRAVAAAGIQLE